MYGASDNVYEGSVNVYGASVNVYGESVNVYGAFGELYGRRVNVTGSSVTCTDAPRGECRLIGPCGQATGSRRPPIAAKRTSIAT